MSSADEWDAYWTGHRQIEINDYELAARKTGSAVIRLNNELDMVPGLSLRYDVALISDHIDATNTRIEAAIRVKDAEINKVYTYYELLRSTGKL
ncbi:MAG TPA: hypothetical protein VL727_22840 [Puia sp.]|jgi:hypothetical protein|nr:hypothetical protein [Puia sp.]